MNGVDTAIKRAVLKWQADERVKKLSHFVDGVPMDDLKTHTKLAEALAERLRLEKP